MWAIFSQVQELLNRLTPNRVSKLDDIRPSVIKSIQHLDAYASDNTTVFVDINIVNPIKTFIIHSHDREVGVTVQLTASGDRVEVSRGPGVDGNTFVVFTVVEYW